MQYKRPCHCISCFGVIIAARVARPDIKDMKEEMLTRLQVHFGTRLNP